MVTAVFALAGTVNAADGQSAHIKAKLIAESPTVPAGGDIRLVLDYTATPGWHTYWINPGDAGLAAKFAWNLPDRVTAGQVLWPAPKTLPTLGLTSFGYDSRTQAVVTLHNGSGLAVGDTLPVKAHIDFLVCADVCIPEGLDVSLNLKVGPLQAGPDAKLVDKAEKAVPQLAKLDATIAVRNGVAELGFRSDDEAVKAALSHPQGAVFYPLQDDVLSVSAPQTLDVGADGFALRTKAVPPRTGACAVESTGPWDVTPSCYRKMGVLKLGDGTSYWVILRNADLEKGTHGLGSAVTSTADTSLGGVALAMLFAFVGGLILNLMPCVFPVLSMKLLSLSRAGHDTGLARREALVYGGGAIASFVGLAVLLEIAQRLGASLGWGFQLQSPYVVAGLALVMLLVALNMSGVFEIGSSLQGMGAGQLDQKRPLLSAFLTGVLAVVVAAPCTAPFMATAIGVALAQGGVTSFAIFIALGLGFALPFVALTYLITLVPGIARALPKPGTWMTWLKIALSLLMYAAALWLVWVFAQQVGAAGVLILIFALACATAAVLPVRFLPKLAKAGFLVAAAVLCIFAATLPRTSKVESISSGLLPHRDFSVETLTSLRGEGKPVLVDLTAAWCVTCKVNEKLVLSTPEFQAALKDTGTVYMVGDWTNQDAEISRYLKLYGRSGVPLYVYYGAHNAEPKVLPQILNTADVVKLVRDGSK